ncbi:hypothetical protein TNIN_316511 [Trichonephila inaurata madagascariensis]|uniref:Uncharacterized protein n=1 Tax=Trichonephila inaurata madagascariensis TaxID=2747483 RepID=A0A8X6IBW4_9ARAC|nr:hypothetical protein TNIN_316511 [Trichonephila inaurata madagascariensis]
MRRVPRAAQTKRRRCAFVGCEGLDSATVEEVRAFFIAGGAAAWIDLPSLLSVRSTTLNIFEIKSLEAQGPQAESIKLLGQKGNDSRLKSECWEQRLFTYGDSIPTSPPYFYCIFHQVTNKFSK